MTDSDQVCAYEPAPVSSRDGLGSIVRGHFFATSVFLTHPSIADP